MKLCHLDFFQLKPKMPPGSLRYLFNPTSDREIQWVLGMPENAQGLQTEEYSSRVEIQIFLIIARDKLFSKKNSHTYQQI